MSEPPGTRAPPARPRLKPEGSEARCEAALGGSLRHNTALCPGSKASPEWGSDRGCPAFSHKNRRSNAPAECLCPAHRARDQPNSAENWRSSGPKPQEQQQSRCKHLSTEAFYTQFYALRSEGCYQNVAVKRPGHAGLVRIFVLIGEAATSPNRLWRTSPHLTRIDAPQSISPGFRWMHTTFLRDFINLSQ